MADQDEQQQRAASDSPAPSGSRTGRAVALARLLHHESTDLLQLYVSSVAVLTSQPADTVPLSRYLRLIEVP